LTHFKTLDDFNVEGKTVIVRVDFNEEGDPTAKLVSRDSYMYVHAVLTLKELAGKGAKIVVLSHQTSIDDDFKEHTEFLQHTLKVPVKNVDDLFGEKAQDAIKQLQNGEILVLKNVYSWSEETKVGSPEQQSKTALVQNLAPLADLFVNDAFSVAHCNNVSVVGFAAVLPSAAGRVMERELKLLDALETSQHPRVYILGGAKVETNLEISKYSLNNKLADNLLLGGVFSQLFMIAKGIPLGNKSTDFLAKTGLLKFVPDMQELLAKYSDKILLPVDVALNVEGKRVEVAIDQMPSEHLISDIGSKTVENYVNILSKTKAIVVHGFLGDYASADFCYGTKTVFEAIANSEAFKLACGGDTSAPFDNFGLSNKIHYISSAGGALVEALRGKKLPGIIALDTTTETKVEKNQTSFREKEIQNFVLQQLNGINITSFEQLNREQSDSQIFRINLTRYDSHLPNWYIVKISKVKDKNAGDAEKESKRYQNILTQTNTDFRKHFVSSTIYYYKGLQIIISDDVQSLHSKKLCDLPLTEKVTYVKYISYDLLAKWNRNTNYSDDISSFFPTLLGERIGVDGKFRQLSEILLVNPQAKAVRFPFTTEEYPNPYYYLTHIPELVDIINSQSKARFITGKTHGDFHARNIICDSTDASKYAIIDYSHYNPQSFVLYDHAVLEVDNYHRFLKGETPYIWQHQLRLLTKRFDIILDANHKENVNYKSELLQFRNSICTGIIKWIKDKHKCNSDRIEVQFTCARIAAGVKAFCSIGKKRQKLQGQTVTSIATEPKTTCVSPIENLEECVLMFYYTAICLKYLFEKMVKYFEWHSDTVTSLNVKYVHSSDGSYKLIWSPNNE